MKYLKPEMDIVEFDESILTTNDDVVGNGSTSNLPGDGDLPAFPTT